MGARNVCRASLTGIGASDISGRRKSQMNKFSTKKLLNSKWTAVTPAHKEKHFTVTEVEYLESGAIDYMSLEAIISKRSVQVNWRDLKDIGRWKQGWK